MSGLQALQQRLADDLASLQLPAARWTPALQHEGRLVADVAIIGAGMAGLALAAALTHRGMAVEVYDEARAGWEGPWATTARMETLRSPKQLAGPALGIASLTFRAWFIAQFGDAAWEALDKIPRLQWMDYLRWYREALGLQVHNEHLVTDVLPRADGKADMVTLIQSLIDRGHAYVAAGEVLFDTASMADYGQLSRRRLDKQQAGARIEVDAHKKNPGDFVLWKESSAEEPGWDASFRLANGETAVIRGRPGWH
ncbi:MAG: FAD-dependent oxidoreductase, partial [Proteobacteria bacterium]|nr:FAD-dependent oxidoreductase [Pseudomonadota bacterium]